MPKLKYDMLLAREDDLVYGLPRDGDNQAVSSRTFDILGIELAHREELIPEETVLKGTPVTVKFTLDEGALPGARRLVLLIGEAEVFTGDWALEN